MTPQTWARIDAVIWVVNTLVLYPLVGFILFEWIGALIGLGLGAAATSLRAQGRTR
jgi:hypothetical protein